MPLVNELLVRLLPSTQMDTLVTPSGTDTVIISSSCTVIFIPVTAIL